MSIYLGSLGRLIELPYVTAQSVAQAEQYSFKQTLEGRNIAERLPRTFRTWSLATQHFRPNEVALLQQFAQGAWGRGPFVFVSADAPVTNMLTPGAASCDPAEVSMLSGAELLGSPPMNLGGDAWAARSVWKTTGNGAGIGGPVPVLPGSRVTASAWVVGAGRVRLVFLDAAGSQVSDADSPLGGSVPVRAHVTATVPGTAASARLYVTASVTQVANPAITWTKSAYEFGNGQGCGKAVVHAVSSELVKAMDNPLGGRWANVGFTVTEVG